MGGMTATMPTRHAPARVPLVRLPDTGARVRHRAAPMVSARKVTMVATCYLGLGLLVGLAFLLRQVAPSPVAMVLFLAMAATLVGVLHPQVGARTVSRR